MKPVILKNRKSWKNYYCYLRKNNFSKRAARQQISYMKRIGVKQVMTGLAPPFFGDCVNVGCRYRSNKYYLSVPRFERGRTESFIHEDDYQRRGFKAHELTEKDRAQGYSWPITFSAVNPDDDEADDTAFKLPG